ncbi:MAG: alanine-tRNA synthetase second additional domain-containing protein [Clostridia bacterium]|nr:alanine-tRNA synthetase second additional domain-containing protein [Clostridia bacterium]
MKISEGTNHLYSTYYAPRGRRRIYDLGIQLAQTYLSPFDHIIGVIGDAGSGKSALIRGMFPGLELTNDDDGVNVRPLPLLEQDSETGFFTPHTYHIDIRFEMGFKPLNVLADAIELAVSRGKRVIVEHFDLVYPLLGTNADLLIGIGEEIVITRPRLFGPVPQEIYDIVYKSLPYRLMAHTAEDLCEYCMPKEELARCIHDDVKHGFMMVFPDTRPKMNIPELEARVLAMIDQGLPISYVDEGHISIGDNLHVCTGPRTHVSNTNLIRNFHLLPHAIFDKKQNAYLVVGCVGEGSEKMLEELEELARWEQQSMDLLRSPFAF